MSQTEPTFLNNLCILHRLVDERRSRTVSLAGGLLVSLGYLLASISSHHLALYLGLGLSLGENS